MYEVCTQEYLDSIDKYIREKTARAQEKLSQPALVVIDALRAEIGLLDLTPESFSSIKNKIKFSIKEIRLLCKAFQSKVDLFYRYERLPFDKEETALSIQTLKQELKDIIDFFFISKVANKNRPTHIRELRGIILNYRGELEEERIKQIRQYLPKLPSFRGRSFLRDCMKEAIEKARNKIQCEFLAYRQQVIVLKNIIQHDRQQHDALLEAERKKYETKLDSLQEELKAEKSERLQLQNTIKNQDQRINKQQIAIEGLHLQISSMLTSMEELRSFVFQKENYLTAQSNTIKNRS